MERKKSVFLRRLDDAVDRRTSLRTAGRVRDVLVESSESVEFSYEWSAGHWKAEVNVCSADVLLETASTIEGEWPLTHGPFFSPLSLYDPDGFFPKLKKAAESPTKEDFRRAINEVLVGEMCEFIGKLRKLPSRPEGFDTVARMVMSGELAEPLKIVSACENFWNGLVNWAAQHDYVISTKRIPF